ncbi:hypothetical protein [Roseivirga sp.]|uniref:hypothetical protein n=1 Tax=Roseivirga sp. TaxID=1964215 RepID=UPI003B519B76
MKNLTRVFAVITAVSVISMVAPNNQFSFGDSDDISCRKEKQEQCTKSKGDICFTTSGCKKRGAEYNVGGELLPL